MSKRIENALVAWRAAERRVLEAGANATAEMYGELAMAHARYQALLAAHEAEYAAEADEASALESVRQAAPAS